MLPDISLVTHSDVSNITNSGLTTPVPRQNAESQSMNGVR